MGRARRPGARRAAITATLALAAAGGLSACGAGGGSGQALAREACVHVNRSLADFQRSQRPETPPQMAARLARRADRELRAALPLAARANSADGTWNALMTAISESAVVDEGHLVASLHAQCVVADTDQNVNPNSTGGTSPGGTTPQNVNPKPAS